MAFKKIPYIVLFLTVYTLALEIRPAVKPPGVLPPARDVDERIINGFTPGRFDVPYVVLLSITLPNGGSVCTGSLIHVNWVVTAGHCAKGATSIQVFLGLYNRTENPSQTVSVPSTSIFVHPGFISNNTTIANDIALLRLNPGANTSFRQIRPITFACASSGSFANRVGRACGWGVTRDNAPTITTVVQCVDLPIITNTECSLAWGTFIRPTNICTKQVNNRTPCQGDSGGPLTTSDGASKRTKLIGATSFGSKPCASNAPNAFTRIASFESWITSISGLTCDRG